MTPPGKHSFARALTCLPNCSVGSEAGNLPSITTTWRPGAAHREASASMPPTELISGANTNTTSASSMLFRRAVCKEISELPNAERTG
eukprot:7525955-Prorocentrum_lima.AAC.1